MARCPADVVATGGTVTPVSKGTAKASFDDTLLSGQRGLRSYAATVRHDAADPAGQDAVRADVACAQGAPVVS